MEELIISIAADTSEIEEDGELIEQNGYQYNIYTSSQELEDAESIDGGFCSGSMSNALEMATAQAKELIKKINK